MNEKKVVKKAAPKKGVSRKVSEKEKYLNYPDPWWFNKESEQMLNGGYLLNGETVNGAIYRVASQASKTLNQPELLKPFFEMIHKGWTSLSTPIWTNYGTDRGLPISCVTGDMWINTRDGGKQARDIKVGDLVLTHTNSYRQVTDLKVTENKDKIYRLKVENRPHVYLTDNHPVLTNMGWIRTDQLEKGVHKVAVNGFVEDLDPIISLIDVGNGAENLNSDILFSYGKWLAEETFDIEGNGKLSDIFSKLFSTNEIDERFLNLPSELLDSILYGFEVGSLPKITTDTYKTNNQKLLIQLYDLYSKTNTEVNFEIDDFGNGSVIPVSQKDTLSKRCSEDGLLYYDIEVVELTNKREAVYDFTVEKDHSFVCQGVVVHNCFNVHIPDSMYGILSKHLEVGTQTQIGGGTSGYFGELRPRGSVIKDNGKSNGSVSFMGLFDTAMNVISQGSCFVAGTEIETEYGWIDIEKYVTERLGDKVRIPIFDTSNSYVDPVGYTNVTEYFENEVTEIYTLENYELELYIQMSGNHNVFLHHPEKGDIFVEAKEIYENQEEYKDCTLYWSSGKFSGKLHTTTPIKFKISRSEENVKVYCVTEPNFHLLRVRDQSGNRILCGNSRRGAFAAYLDIDHGDIEEFLQIRDIGNPLQTIMTGVCVPDYWMQEMIDGDSEKRNLWAKVLRSRQEKGMPYIFFSDNVNKGKPQVYKDKGAMIRSSNLC